MPPKDRLLQHDSHDNGACLSLLPEAPTESEGQDAAQPPSVYTCANRSPDEPCVRHSDSLVVFAQHPENE